MSTIVEPVAWMMTCWRLPSTIPPCLRRIRLPWFSNWRENSSTTDLHLTHNTLICAKCWGNCRRRHGQKSTPIWTRLSASLQLTWNWKSRKSVTRPRKSKSSSKKWNRRCKSNNQKLIVVVYTASSRRGESCWGLPPTTYKLIGDNLHPNGSHKFI